MSYAPVSHTMSQRTMRESKFGTYLSEACSEERDSLLRLSQATMPILNASNQFSGNGVAITKDCVLTSGHCVRQPFGWTLDPHGRAISGEVIFEGKSLDFKILQFTKAIFQPVACSVTPAIGESVQLYFKKDPISERYAQHVKPFTSDDGVYATRSDHASVETFRGESGAPRMHSYSGLVHAIHQGEREALKVNDIFLELDTAAHRGNAVAIQLLRRMEIPDRQMAYISASTIAIRPGNVREEGPHIIGRLTYDRTHFSYAESGNRGGGPRGIEIWKNGAINSKRTYTISPNPHENSKYNGGGQSELYFDIAYAFSQEWEKSPTQKVVKSLKENYMVQLQP